MSTLLVEKKNSDAVFAEISWLLPLSGLRDKIFFCLRFLI
jgi:hypothetical protein